MSLNSLLIPILPAGVYLTALLIRFTRICFVFVISHRTCGCSTCVSNIRCSSFFISWLYPIAASCSYFCYPSFFFLFWQSNLSYCIFCFKTSRKVSSIFLLSTGFAICPFIPFSNAFFLSSSNALAVIAMIGIPAFFLSSSLLIA